MSPKTLLAFAVLLLVQLLHLQAQTPQRQAAQPKQQYARFEQTPPYIPPQPLAETAVDSYVKEFVQRYLQTFEQHMWHHLREEVRFLQEADRTLTQAAVPENYNHGRVVELLQAASDQSENVRIAMSTRDVKKASEESKAYLSTIARLMAHFEDLMDQQLQQGRIGYMQNMAKLWYESYAALPTEYKKGLLAEIHDDFGKVTSTQNYYLSTRIQLSWALTRLYVQVLEQPEWLIIPV